MRTTSLHQHLCLLRGLALAEGALLVLPRMCTRRVGEGCGGEARPIPARAGRWAEPAIPLNCEELLRNPTTLNGGVSYATYLGPRGLKASSETARTCAKS